MMASGCALGQTAMLLRFKHSIQDDPVRASAMHRLEPKKDSQTAANVVLHKAVVPAPTDAATVRGVRTTARA